MVKVECFGQLLVIATSEGQTVQVPTGANVCERIVQRQDLDVG